MRRRVAAVLLAVVAAFAAGASTHPQARGAIPACQEDEVVVGYGDFRGPVKGWERYGCSPLDDLL